MTAEPTHRDQARHIRAKLVEQLETLKLLELALRLRPDQDIHERDRADTVFVASDHVQQAMDALEMTAHE